MTRYKFHKKDFSSGFFLLALGLFLVFSSIRLSVWTGLGPQEGFFPLVTGIIIIGCSLIIVIKSLSLTQVTEKEGKFNEQEKNEVNIFKVFSYGLLMLFYAILMESVGFLITSALFLTLILKYVEKQDCKITILVALASIIISYLLFVYFLGVPLPKGIVK